MVNPHSFCAWKKFKKCNPFSNFLVSATEKDFLTMPYCVFTSSHYRYRCQWERNQSLNVCVSQSSRSVWVPSHGQLCSFPSPPSQPLLSSWSTAVPLFFCWEAIALCHRCKPLLYLFMYHAVSLMSPIAVFKGMMQIHEQIVLFLHGSVCCCICAHIDQDRSDCKCEAQSCKCGDNCSCSKPIYM